MEKVILAFETEKNAQRIKEILESAGVAECLICRSAHEAKRVAGEQGIGAIVCGYKLTDETAEGLYADLSPYCSMLVIALQDLLELISSRDILKLRAPVIRSDLCASVQTLLLRAGCRQERREDRRSAQEKTIIARAKGALMTGRGMSEEQAHRYLQKRSMDTGTKLVQTAQMVLDGKLDH